MTDAGTLATTAQVLFMLGENATANQVLEANTNFAILFAEAEIFLDTDEDFVANIRKTSLSLRSLGQSSRNLSRSKS